jgi:hypothetical protein
MAFNEFQSETGELGKRQLDFNKNVPIRTQHIKDHFGSINPHRFIRCFECLVAACESLEDTLTVGD